MQNMSNKELTSLISENLVSIDNVNNIIANTLHNQEQKINNISTISSSINDSLTYIYDNLYKMSSTFLYFFYTPIKGNNIIQIKDINLGNMDINSTQTNTTLLDSIKESSKCIGITLDKQNDELNQLNKKNIENETILQKNINLTKNLINYYK